MPHAIADYDTDLIQLNVWTGTKWVNIFDGNDMNNMNIDLHRVAKVVDDQVVQINDAVKRADDAVKQAGKAIDDSATNKQAIDDVNKAVDEAKQSASDALDRIKSLATDSTIEDIQKQIKDTSDSITKIRDDQTAHLKDVTDQINDAVAKAKAAADSLNAKTEALQSAVKNAQSDATVATQTASEANITAIDAKGDAAVAMTTAKQVTVDMKNVQNDILAAKATASEATITAGNAASDAATAKVTASEASVTATDAKSDVAQVKTTAQSISSRVSVVESDANKKIAANSTAIEQNKNAISLKADQSTVDKVNDVLDETKAQLQVQAGQINSKVSETELKKVSDKADSAVAGSTKAESDAQAASTKADSAIASAAKNTTAIDQNSKAIALKADQTTVDKLNKTVTDNSAAVEVLNGEITSKVDSTTVNKLIDSKGFATTEQAQALIDQTANKISGTITDLKTTVDKNGNLISTTVDRLTNVTQTVDGLQTVVKSKADQSQITQLSNQLTAKVSTEDYQTEIAALEKNLNLRVQKGDVISQINLEAGGDGLISIQNGKGKLMLDADSVVFGNKAFIPSAAITNINADKITTGTLDAAKLNVKNFSADNIHGGTLDVGNMHVKNFSANDIEAGTLSGVTIKSGNTTDFFQTSKDNIFWIANNGEQSALLGRGEYINFPGFNIFDSHAIYLGTWAGADLKNGNINDNGGSLGHPKFNIELPGDSGFDLFSKSGDMGSTGVPLDNSRISGWVGQDEFFSLEQTQGFRCELNPDTNTSQFVIQKNDHFGAYFGEGDAGNQINLVAGGAGNQINLVANGGVNVAGNFHVTGAKNSIVNTKQGYLAINAYETAEYYFGDIGEANTGENSQVVIGIDKIFSETINTTVPYQVFITPYSDCHVWVDQRFGNRFVVKSDKPNAQFGWELKAKRKGYENYRLRHVDGIKEKGEFKV